MLITCACSVSAVLKNIPARAQLPPNVVIQYRIWSPSSLQRGPQAPGNRWLKTTKRIWSSLQWPYFYPRKESGVKNASLPPVYTTEWSYIAPALSRHPPKPSPHTHARKLCRFRGPRWNTGCQFNLNFRSTTKIFTISMSQLLRGAYLS